jgi:hypothetical protein
MRLATFHIANMKIVNVEMLKKFINDIYGGSFYGGSGKIFGHKHALMYYYNMDEIPEKALEIIMGLMDNDIKVDAFEWEGTNYRLRWVY